MNQSSDDQERISTPAYFVTKFKNKVWSARTQKQKWIIAAVFIFFIIIIYQLIHHRNHNSFDKNSMMPSVVVAKATTADVPVYLTGLGAVTPTDNIIIRTQVNGQLQHIYFREGQKVKAGELLALIDPRPYQAQLTQYQGQLLRDQALLTNALADLKRYKKLYPIGAVSKQTLDTQTALVKQYQGAVKSDQGLVATTQVNLSYCHITSPINGRVGLRQVDPGNLVQTSDTAGLVVVNGVDPITAVFTLPEDNIPQLQQQLDVGKTLTAYAYDRAQTKLLAQGILLTIDNQIDPSTGTVKLKASFPNSHDQLFPSQFVNIKLLVNTLRHATIIPTAGLQHGNQNNFVYLVNADHTVSVKSVTPGVNFGENTVITQGIKAGQAVVVEGADKLTDGATVLLPGESPPPNSKHKRGHHGHGIS